MRRRTHPRGGGEEGQTLIEMAVALPVFCMMLFGIFGFAIVLFGWCNITYASRAAARYASLHSGTSLVPATTATVSAVVTPYLVAVAAGGSSTTVTYTPGNTIGATVKVSVSAKYNVVMPFTSYNSFTMTSAAQRTITR